MSCPSCEPGDQDTQIPLLLYEGSEWRLEHVHPTGRLGSSVIVTHRAAGAPHALNKEEWDELQWLLGCWLPLLRTLTNCTTEQIANATQCVAGKVCLQIEPVVEQQKQLPNEAVASFCVQARKRLLAHLEDPRLLDIDNTLRLRSPVLADAPQLFGQVNRNRAYLGKWLPWVEHSQSEDDSRNFIRLTQRMRRCNRQHNFVIEYQGSIVGSMGLVKDSSESHIAGLGYWISEDCAGQGLTRRAAERLVRYGFESLKLSRIEIKVHPDNAASHRVAERLGAVREGIARGGILLAGNKIADAVIYSIIK